MTTSQSSSKPQRILPHERAPLFLLALIFVCLKTGLELSGNLAEVIYFRRQGIENLPLLYSIEPLAMVFILIIFGLIVERLDHQKLLFGLNLIFSCLLVLAYFLILIGWSQVYFVFYLSQRIFFALLPLVFWLVCIDLFDIRQAKRLFVLIVAGGLVGTLLGNLLTGLLPGIFGAEKTLALTSMFFLSSLGLGIWLAKLSLPKSIVKPQNSNEAKLSPTLQLDLFKQPFIRVFSIVILITGMLEPFWRYEINAIANQSFASESSLIAFYGYLKGAAVLVVVLVQLFLVGKLIEKIGIPASISVHPFGLVVVMLLLGFFPTLWMAVASVSLIGIVRIGFDESGRKTIMGIFSLQERFRVSTFERQMTYLGIFLGSLFLMWAVKNLSMVQINWIAAGFAAAWVLVFPRFRAQYAQACLVRGQSPLDQIDFPPVTSQEQMFLEQLNHSSPEVLWSPVWLVRHHGLRALLTRSQSISAIEALIAVQLEHAERLETWRSAISVQKLIREGRIAAAQACLLLLEKLHPAGEMRVAARMLRSPVSDLRANGLEALDILLRGAQKKRLMALFESAWAQGNPPTGALNQTDMQAISAEMISSLDPEIAFWGRVWQLRQGNGAYATPQAISTNIPGGSGALHASVTYPKTGVEAMELAEKIDTLRASETFATLSEAELRILALCTREVSHAPDTVIFEEGQVGSALYIILDGHVELASVEQRKSLQALNPGSVFGEYALFTKEPYPLTAVTISATRLLVLERETFLELIQYYPNFSLSLLQNLAKRHEKATALLQEIWI